ncbi:MAG: hypothetical protein K8E66_10765, partial [Phycisphaerales bacterium]|nr:hypothetical protein [Phycisphaerales bacterium]
HDHLNDPALRDAAERLDALGVLDRTEPDAGFEHRIAASTRPGVLASVRPSRARHLLSSWLALPIAASLLIGVVGLWIIQSAPTPKTPPVDSVAWSVEDVEDFLFIDALADEQGLLDVEFNTESAEEQTADELLFDVFGYEGGPS